MSATPFVGDIMMCAFDFAPKNFMKCEGQLLRVDQYAALYAVLKATYGGDGINTFALPDLRGRVPMHSFPPGSPQHVLGEAGGAATVALTVDELPAHTHTVEPRVPAGVSADTDNPVNAYFAPTDAPAYTDTPSGESGPLQAQLHAEPAGMGNPHNNMQPYLTINFVICLYGDFPMRP